VSRIKNRALNLLFVLVL